MTAVLGNVYFNVSTTVSSYLIELVSCLMARISAWGIISLRYNYPFIAQGIFIILFNEVYVIVISLTGIRNSW